MERLVEMKIAKFNILWILNCYYRLFPLIYISYDSEGMTIQGSCEEQRILTTTIIPRESFEHYECEESMVLAVPLHLGKLGGRCVSIEVLKMDSWRVKNVFKSNNGVSYEAISSYMYKLSDHPKITESISFERYSSAKKFLSCIEDPKGEVEVEVNGGCNVQGGNFSHFKISSWRPLWGPARQRSRRTILRDTNHTFETIKQVSGDGY